MLDFSSIVPHLQARITEKVDYFDQKEFELSSKYGKQAVTYTKYKAVVELKPISYYNFNYNCFVEFVHLNKTVEKHCSELCKFSHLPRFKLTQIWIRSDELTDSFIEFCEKQVFTANEVYFVWYSRRTGDVDFSALKIILEVFNVTRLESNALDLCILSLPKIRDIRLVILSFDKIPNEQLLLLRSSAILLNYHDKNRFSVITNLFLKQWFNKERSMEWFEIFTDYKYSVEKIFFIDYEYSVERDGRKKEIMFSGLPFETIWQESGGIALQLRFFKELGIWEDADRYPDYGEHLMIIDRGDKKLLVVIFETHARETLIAQECMEQEHVLRIKYRDGDSDDNFFYI